jgi:hypothetical protein
LFSNNKITYSFGTVECISQGKNNSNLITKADLNSSLSENQLIASGKGSRAEVQFENLTFRIGSLSVAKWNGENKFWIHSGSLLFCLPETTTCEFSSSQAKCQLQAKGTFIIEATSNGGFKLIPLEAKGFIKTENGDKKELIGGRLLLILGNPTQFGDAYDIDIMLLLKSSRLINAFPSPLPTFERIGLAVYVQELKLKGKYDALIGDATTNENLQLWKFGKKTGVEPSTSQSPESKKGFFKSFFGKE